VGNLLKKPSKTLDPNAFNDWSFFAQRFIASKNSHLRKDQRRALSRHTRGLAGTRLVHKRSSK
jgi:hypothetical protein